MSSFDHGHSPRNVVDFEEFKTRRLASGEGSDQRREPEARPHLALPHGLARLRPRGGERSAATDFAALVASAGEDTRRQLADHIAAARLDEPVEIDEDQAAADTRVLRTYLRYVGDGIRMTKAGWLPPVIVSALVDEFEPGTRRFGNADREKRVGPVLLLRFMAERLGLVTQSTYDIMPTQRAKELREAPVELWWHVAEQLPVERGDAGRDTALLLLLLLAAEKAPSRQQLESTLDGLARLIGWQNDDSRAGAAYFNVIWTVDVLLAARNREGLPPSALAKRVRSFEGTSALARAALAGRS